MFKGLLTLLHDLNASRKASGHVAMLHTGRVGSTVVASMLETHSQLRWDGEIFEPRFREDVGRPLRPAINRDRLPPLIDLRARVGAAERAGLRYGFETKHHYDHHGYIYRMRVESLAERLEQLGFSHFIEVRRENYLRQTVSAIRYFKTGRSHFRPEQKIDRRPLEIDLLSVPFGRKSTSLRQRFSEYDALHHQTHEALANRRALYLSYERDIEKDPRNAYARICEFLEMPAEPAEIKFRRTNDLPLTELIANFDEVVEHLSGTKYEWMLEQQLTSVEQGADFSTKEVSS